MSEEWKPHRPKDPRDVIDQDDWVVTKREWMYWSDSGGRNINRVRLTPYHRHWTGPWDGMYSIDPNTNTCKTCGAHMPEYIVGFLALVEWGLDTTTRYDVYGI